MKSPRWLLFKAGSRRGDCSPSIGKPTCTGETGLGTSGPSGVHHPVQWSPSGSQSRWNLWAWVPCASGRKQGEGDANRTAPDLCRFSHSNRPGAQACGTTSPLGHLQWPCCHPAARGPSRLQPPCPLRVPHEVTCPGLALTVRLPSGGLLLSLLAPLFSQRMSPSDMLCTFPGTDHRLYARER